MQKVKDGRLWIILLVGVGGLCSLRAVASRRLHSSSSPLQPPKVGGLAPDFSLTDYRGKTYRLSDFRGKKVLLNFFCGCGACCTMAQEWEKQFSNLDGIQLLAIADLSPTAAADFRKDTGIKFPLLFDPFGKVAQRYQSVSCPRCWVVNEEGKVVYADPQLQGDLVDRVSKVKQLLAAKS
jgi:peroxiredoxin